MPNLPIGELVLLLLVGNAGAYITNSSVSWCCGCVGVWWTYHCSRERSARRRGGGGYLYICKHLSKGHKNVQLFQSFNIPVVGIAVAAATTAVEDTVDDILVNGVVIQQWPFSMLEFKFMSSEVSNRSLWLLVLLWPVLLVGCSSVHFFLSRIEGLLTLRPLLLLPLEQCVDLWTVDATAAADAVETSLVVVALVVWWADGEEDGYELLVIGLMLSMLWRLLMCCRLSRPKLLLLLFEEFT